jgi:predicted acyl esterase
VALAVALVVAGPANAFTKTDGRSVMDDGVALATSLYVPDGPQPTAGWPAIMMLHGLGQTRATTNDLAEHWFADRGYVVLTWDARGHGASGGSIGLAGSRDVADVRALESELAARPDVDDLHVGAWGVSYGGGETWNAAAGGVPFAAIVIVATWTDLYRAFFPQDLARSGIVGLLLGGGTAPKLDPQLATFRDRALRSTDLADLRRITAERSAASRLGRLTVPTLMIQGRRDFVFPLDQATDAFTRLAGPKHLFVGDGGHTPSTFSSPDADYGMTLARRWFDRYLRGEANGVDREPPVEVSPDPWQGRTAHYAALPPTRPLVLQLPGTSTVPPGEHALRTGEPLAARTDTFGEGVVRLTATATGGWSRVVVALTAVTPAGQEIVVSVGGVAARPGRQTYSIRLLSDSTALPAGSRLRLAVGDSTAGTPAGLVYLDLPCPAQARLVVGRATLTLPVLTRPISD